jgi:phospholipid/cholesterol/gamma-HCH transport system permease protein
MTEQLVRPPGTPPRPPARAATVPPTPVPWARYLNGPGRSVAKLGEQIRFHGRALGLLPHALVNYRREVVRLLAEVSLGSGALAMIGGTVVIVTFMTGAVGIEVGLQGFSQLGQMGMSALAGFISAYVNTREAAPLIAMIALIATVGGGFTAQLGAMRVAEEIDALETMGVRSISFLVSTRILAGIIAVAPLYATALIISYASTRLIITVAYHQAGGTYGHYFSVFLAPQDIVISLVKVLVMATVVILVHCYYGYTATGGPVGVGIAVGRAVRASLIIVMMTDLVLSMTLYGHSTTINITG